MIFLRGYAGSKASKAIGVAIINSTMGHKNGGAKAGVVYASPWQLTA